MNAWTKFFSTRVVRIGIGLMISAASLFMALREVNFGEVRGVISQANGGLVLLALISTSANNLLKALRWKILLGPAGKRISYYNILMSYMVGQMFNALFPARTGELSRIYVIGEMGAERAYVLGTLLMEKVLDMISYTLLIIWILLWVPLPDWLGQSGWAFTAATIAAVLGMLWVFTRRQSLLARVDKGLRRLPARLHEFGVGQLQSGISSLAILKDKGDLFLIAMLTVGVWGLAVATNSISLRALQIELPAAGAIIVLIILQVGLSLPGAPGKFGLFEYACVLALAIFGVSQAPAFSFGLLLHAVVLAPVMLSGMIFFWWLGLGEKRLKNVQKSDDQGEQLS